MYMESSMHLYTGVYSEMCQSTTVLAVKSTCEFRRIIHLYCHIGFLPVNSGERKAIFGFVIGHTKLHSF